MRDRSTLRRRGLLLLLALGLCASPARAQEAPAELLSRAWDQYGLQLFSNADELFEAVVDAEEASQDERWQALLGQAFIIHYQMPRRDPQAAIVQYEVLLKEVGDQDEWRGRVLGRLADCYVEITPPEMDKARGLERADELAADFAGTPFESVFHGMRAEMAFFIDDYAPPLRPRPQDEAGKERADGC